MPSCQSNKSVEVSHLKSAALSPPLHIRPCKVGFFEVVTPLFTRGVVFARDSPLLEAGYRDPAYNGARKYKDARGTQRAARA